MTPRKIAFLTLRGSYASAIGSFQSEDRCRGDASTKTKDTTMAALVMMHGAR